MSQSLLPNEILIELISVMSTAAIKAFRSTSRKHNVLVNATLRNDFPVFSLSIDSGDFQDGSAVALLPVPPTAFTPYLDVTIHDFEAFASRPVENDLLLAYAHRLCTLWINDFTSTTHQQFTTLRQIFGVQAIRLRTLHLGYLPSEHVDVQQALVSGWLSGRAPKLDDIVLGGNWSLRGNGCPARNLDVTMTTPLIDLAEELNTLPLAFPNLQIFSCEFTAQENVLGLPAGPVTENTRQFLSHLRDVSMHIIDPFTSSALRVLLSGVVFPRAQIDFDNASPEAYSFAGWVTRQHVLGAYIFASIHGEDETADPLFTRFRLCAAPGMTSLGYNFNREFGTGSFLDTIRPFGHAIAELNVDLGELFTSVTEIWPNMPALRIMRLYCQHLAVTHGRPRAMTLPSNCVIEIRPFFHKTLAVEHARGIDLAFGRGRTRMHVKICGVGVMPDVMAILQTSFDVEVVANEEPLEDAS